MGFGGASFFFVEDEDEVPHEAIEDLDVEEELALTVATATAVRAKANSTRPNILLERAMKRVRMSYYVACV